MDCIVIMPLGRFRKGILLAFPMILVALGVSASVASEPKSIALISMLIFSGIIMSVGMYMDYRMSERSNGSLQDLKNQLDPMMAPTFQSILFLHSTVMTLFLILLIRIEANDIFGGDPQNLNFGQKFSSGEISEEDNIAFTAEATSVGHSIQGVLCALLCYPAITGWLVRGGKLGYSKKVGYLLLLCQLASAALSIYPSYSLIKRLYKDAEVFSRTSHMNNATEWVLGYILGASLGYFLTVVIKTHIIKMGNGMNLSLLLESFKIPESVETLENGEIKYGYGKAGEFRSVLQSSIYKVLDTISIILLVSFSVTTLLTGVFIGNTWYLQELTMSSPNYEIIGGYAIMWVLSLGFTFFLYRDLRIQNHSIQ
jgi:hypothetical protein